MINIGNINIVGAEYNLIYHTDFKELQEVSRKRDERYRINETEDKDRQAIDGYCDYSSKEIHVFCDEYTDKNYFYMVLHHEICHAFLYEIGNTNHDNEEFVDKLSKWTPKINLIFEDGMKKFYDYNDKRKKGKKK